jgi:diguanylate cyclase (GGDEF)-like protein
MTDQSSRGYISPAGAIPDTRGAAPLLGLAAMVFDWLRSTRAATSGEIRDRLIQTVMDRKAPIVFGIVSIGLMAAFAGVRTGETWPWVWLLAELVLSGVRLSILAFAPRQHGHVKDRTLAILMVLGLSWCAVFGAGLHFCVMTGDPVLMILAGINMAGIIGAITSRNAAMPRYGITAIVICALPYGAALLRVDGIVPELSGLSIIGLMVPLWVGVMSAIMVQNYEIAVRMIRAEIATRHIARTDGLTGLPNRMYLEEILADTCRPGLAAEEATEHARFAMLCIDLDGFKLVNDRHGHTAGDRLLAAVGRRLAHSVREGDRVFRYGGDEFVALLPEASAREAAFIGSRIITALGRPFDIGVGETVRIGASIGSVRAPEDGDTAARLISLADAALYQAKTAGKGLYRAHGKGAA